MNQAAARGAPGMDVPRKRETRPPTRLGRTLDAPRAQPGRTQDMFKMHASQTGTPKTRSGCTWQIPPSFTQLARAEAQDEQKLVSERGQGRKALRATAEWQGARARDRQGGHGARERCDEREDREGRSGREARMRREKKRGSKA